ncbi:jg19496 [Pararge aegeria aegeria]|uniref:Jg19496 protein n=1 Tax=Pararge aegeria aegeria TaxID=348720 RepID=A0A8S4RIJ6_9NEOP|nr:jg19496 [Pararge aegeria aegeria]
MDCAHATDVSRCWCGDRALESAVLPLHELINIKRLARSRWIQVAQNRNADDDNANWLKCRQLEHSKCTALSRLRRVPAAKDARIGAVVPPPGESGYGNYNRCATCPLGRDGTTSHDKSRDQTRLSGRKLDANLS